MKTLISQAGSVGECALVYPNNGLWSMILYGTHEEACIEAAKKVAKDHVGARVFVMKVEKEFRSVAEVYEVKRCVTL